VPDRGARRDRGTRPRRGVPGHGPLSGVEGPREMQAYLRYVRAETKRCFDAGLPALEAARRIGPGPVRALDRARAHPLQRGARVPRAARRAVRRADRRDGALPRHVRAARGAAGGSVGARRRGRPRRSRSGTDGRLHHGQTSRAAPSKVAARPPRRRTRAAATPRTRSLASRGSRARRARRVSRAAGARRPRRRRAGGAGVRAARRPR